MLVRSSPVNSRKKSGLWGNALSYHPCKWCAPFSHTSFCVHVNHGLSQQSSKEDYKPWKWGATARYYTSHTRTMLPMRKSVPNPAGNWTTWKPPDHRKYMQTAVVWSCLLLIRSGQNHLARHSERGKKTRQTEEEIGRQHQGMDKPGDHQVTEGSGDQEKWRNCLRNHLWCPNNSCG